MIGGKSEITLTEQQQLIILKTWNDNKENPPSLNDLINAAYPDRPDLDGRCAEGRAVKKFLASRSIVARKSYDYVPKKPIELNEEQKEFIANNSPTMKAAEMAEVIFKKNGLTNLHGETIAVISYLKTLPENIKYEDPNAKDVNRYSPPKNEDRMFLRVNKYIHDSLDKEKLTPRDRAGLNALIRFMHTYRFLHQINSFSSQVDRDLFESSFVRYCYDKPDLTQEEVDQYIILATEVVISSSIQAIIQNLQGEINSEVEAGNKIPMAIVEAVNSAREEYNQSTIRQQKLTNDLKVKRSDRLSKQIKENASILNLVGMWKEEETRQQLIKLAEKRKELVKNEINRLSSMDEVKAKILGISESEILDG